MSVQVVDRGKLGVLSRIGQGGQGVVFAAPNVTTKFAASMVYKEYKSQALAGIDFTALAAMPALVEDALSYKEAERLIGLAAWPCAIVHDGGVPSGFVMPVIPEQFFVELTTVKGTSSVTAEFQHLLNHPSVLAARGTSIDDAQRYSLLREVASGLAFMHKHGVCVGDISPKNLLYSLAPAEAVYLIDCDAMRIDGVSALTQVETPGWQVPAGEELATIYSDTYKLGLLALRLLVGDHDTTNPAHLPAGTPVLLRQLITDTLTRPPLQRPLPAAWTYVLGHAIEEVQHRSAATPPSPAAVAAVVPVVAPVVPTVYSRPPSGQGYSQPAPSAVQPPPPVGPPLSGAWATPANKSSSLTKAIVGVGAALVIAIIVGAIILANNNTDQPQATPTKQAMAPKTVTVSTTPPAPVTTHKPSANTVPPKPSSSAPPPTKGDLGLRTPMSYPRCNGQGIVILGSVTTPGLYAAGVQRLLDAHPGAYYLRTDQACPSLRQATDEGNPIYAVFSLGGSTLSDVCGAVFTAGGNAYGKWLDTTSDPERGITC